MQGWQPPGVQIGPRQLGASDSSGYDASSVSDSEEDKEAERARGKAAPRKPPASARSRVAPTTEKERLTGR